MKSIIHKTSLVVAMSLASTQVFAGGGPDNTKPKTAKVIMRDEGITDSRSQAARLTRAKKTNINVTRHIKERKIQAVSSPGAGLIMDKKTLTQMRESEEKVLATLWRNMFAYQVERRLGVADSKEKLTTLSGKNEKWEYYSLGHSTTVTLFFRNGRLIDVKRKPAAPKGKAKTKKKKTEKTKIIQLDK